MIRITLSGANPINEEMNDYLNLMGMYAAVEEGLLPKVEYQREVDRLEQKWGKTTA